MNEDFVITARELQANGFCAHGVKLWFAQYGLDFKDYVKNGIPASVLLATGDALGERAVESVRAYRE